MTHPSPKRKANPSSLTERNTKHSFISHWTYSTLSLSLCVFAVVLVLDATPIHERPLLAPLTVVKASDAAYRHKFRVYARGVWKVTYLREREAERVGAMVYIPLRMYRCLSSAWTSDTWILLTRRESSYLFVALIVWVSNNIYYSLFINTIL